MSAVRRPRHGRSPSRAKRAKSNGDAFVVRPDDEGAGWFIVLSDGASSSAFASSWARALVETVTSGWFADSDFDELLDPVRKKFDPLVSRPDANFILEDKWNEEGSHATVVAAWVRPGASGADVSAVAVGDSVIGFSLVGQPRCGRCLRQRTSLLVQPSCRRNRGHGPRSNARRSKSRQAMCCSVRQTGSGSGLRLIRTTKSQLSADSCALWRNHPNAAFGPRWSRSAEMKRLMRWTMTSPSCAWMCPDPMPSVRRCCCGWRAVSGMILPGFVTGGAHGDEHNGEPALASPVGRVRRRHQGCSRRRAGCAQ